MDQVISFEDVIKILSDKNPDKRNQGIKQLKDRVQKLVFKQNFERIILLIQELSNRFFISATLQLKKSGSVAFQCIAQILTEQNNQLVGKIIQDLVNGILENINDKDEKCRFVMFDCLLQLSNILKSSILLCFNDIFKNVLLRQAENDNNLESISSLDQNLKQIVQQSTNPNKNNYFDVQSFMMQLPKRMDTKNYKVRAIIFEWIKKLNIFYDKYLYKYFPYFLEGLFNMMGEQQQHQDVDYFCTHSLLIQIQLHANDDQSINEDIIDLLIKQLTTKKKTANNFGRLNVMLWIQEYLRILQRQLESEEPNTKNSFQQSKSGQINLSRSNTIPINNIIIEQESPLKQTILNKFGKILEPTLILLSHDEEEIRKVAITVNETLFKLMDKLKNSTIIFINIQPTIQEMLSGKKTKTVEESLKWFKKLLEIYPDQTIPTIDEMINKLIDKLNDPEKEVVHSVIQVLASISLHNNIFDKVVDNILQFFSKHKEAHEKRGEKIFQKLCSLLIPKDVYVTIAAKLEKYYSKNNLYFISLTVQHLTNLLINEQDLQSLRNILRNMKYENEITIRTNNQLIFQTLYKTFCYNPTSVITLCLLSEEYELAYNIIISFSEIELDLNILSDIAKLINAIELPVFVFLRLQLLNQCQNKYLTQFFYGLMMLIPQGEQFQLLKRRLKDISKFQIQEDPKLQTKNQDFLDINELMRLFRIIRLQWLNQYQNYR